MAGILHSTILDDEAVTIAQGKWEDTPDGRVLAISGDTFSSSHGKEIFKIPEFLNSIATLVFCGFESGFARRLWTLYEGPKIYVGPKMQLSTSLEDIETIIEFAQGYIRTIADKKDAADREDDWKKVLSAFGLSEDLQARILDESFQNLRLTAKASEWVIDTLQIGWEFLLDLNHRVKFIQGQSYSYHKSQPTIKFTQPVPNINDFIQDINIDPAKAIPDRCHYALAQYKSISPYPAILFKGSTRSRLMNGFFQRKDLVDLGKFYSNPPTDFHPTSFETLYFTNNLEVAQQYACWAVRRAPFETGGILQLAVPMDLLQTAVVVPNNIWSELVWYSRHDYPKYRLQSTPQVVDPFLNEQLLSGPICPQSNNLVLDMGGKGQLKKFTLADGSEASQTVFLRPGRFISRCEEFVWVVSSVHWRTGVVNPDPVTKFGLSVAGPNDLDE